MEASRALLPLEAASPPLTRIVGECDVVGSGLLFGVDERVAQHHRDARVPESNLSRTYPEPGVRNERLAEPTCL